MAGSIASLFVEIGAKTDGVESGLSKVASQMQGLAGKASGLVSAAATGFGMAIAQPILGGVGSAFQAVTSGVMDTNAALQNSGVAWGVLLGGADQAKQKIAELYQFGAVTPFNFQEVDQAARLLQTFGGNALNTKDTLTMVGNAASGTGYRFQDVAFWTGRLYDALQNGQPMGDALMNLQQMGVLSGETRNKLEQLQKEGAKGPELWAAYTQSQQRFNGMMEQQSVTFSGMLSTMQDNLNQLLATAGKPIFDAMTAGLTKLNALLSSDAMGAFVQRVGSGIASLLTAVFGFVQRAIPVIQAFGQAFVAVIRGLANGDMQSAFLAVMNVIGKVFGLSSMAPVASFVGQVMLKFFQLRDAVGAVLSFLGGKVSDFVDNLAVMLGIDPGEWGNGFGERLKEVGAILVEIGTRAINFGRSIMNVVGPFVAGFAGVVAAVGGVNIAFAALSAIAVPIIAAIGAALAFLTSPITLIAIAVGVLAAAWVNNWGNVQGIILGTVLPALQNLWTMLQTGFATIQPLLVQFGQFLINAFQQAIPLVIQFATGLLPMLAQGWQMVQQAVAVIAPVLQAIWQGIQNGLAVALPALQQFGQALMSGIGGALQVIGPLLQGLFSQIQAQLPAMQANWNQLVGIFNQVKEAISGLAPVFTVVAAVIGGVVVAAVGILLGALGGLIGFFTGFLPGAMQTASGVLTALGGAFQVLSSIVVGAVKIIVDLIHGDWSQAWNDAKSMVSGVVDGIKSIVSGLATAVTGFISGMIDGVKGLVSGFVTTIIAFFQNLADVIVGHSIIPDMCTAIVTVFTTFVSQVSALITAFVTTIINFFTNLATSVGTEVQNLVALALSTFDSLRSGALATVQDLYDGVIGKFLALASNVTSAMQGLANTVIGALTSLAGSAASEAASIGSAIISGIAGAVSSGAGAIESAVSSAVSNALNAAKNILGIHSPSRAFAELGMYSMAGFALGITGNSRLASSAVADTLGGLAGTASLAGNIASGAAGLGGQTLIHVEVHGSLIHQSELDDAVIAAVNRGQQQGRI